MSSSSNRPLWRTGTRRAIEMVKEAQAIQRAQAQELEDAILLAECRRRGWVVSAYCQCEACKRAARWPYPPLADEEEPLPFEVRDAD